MGGKLTRVLGVAMALALSACGWSKLQQGEPDFNTRILLPSGSTQSARDTSNAGVLYPLAAPPACKPNDASADTELDSDPTARRNCIFALVALIDDWYREYRITLHHFVDYGDAVADIGSLGLSTAATATVTATAKTVLSAINTGITGSKSIINTDLLYKQAVELILTQMDKDRLQTLSVIQQQLNGSGNYNMSAARVDLLTYYADGTWDHAVTSLQAQTSYNLANCQTTANTVKTTGSGAATTPDCNLGASAPSIPGVIMAVGQPSLAAGTVAVPITVGAVSDDQAKITLGGLPNGAKIAGITPKSSAQFSYSKDSDNIITVKATSQATTLQVALSGLSSHDSFTVQAEGTKAGKSTGLTTLQHVTVP